MDKSKKSQFLKLSLIALLFIITPLIPTMFRSIYLYFIFNVLIVALGAEAGLLPFFSKSSNDQKYVNTTVANPPVTAGDNSNSSKSEEILKPKVVEKCSTLKVSKVKKCPSTPSIFFIGHGENKAGVMIGEEEEEEVIGGQELFTKAEMFIGNFYKQLKMQREDSWNRIHGFIKKPFYPK